MRSLGLFLFLAACATEPGAGSQDPSGGGKADGTDSSVLAPKYALELVSKTKVEDTRDSSRSTYTLRARALVTTTQPDADTVKLSVKLCDVTLPMVSSYQPTLDPAFVATIPKLSLTGHITDEGLATDPAALVLGAALHDPLDDTLPAAGTDSRVRDQDADGNPGVSVHIQGYGSIFTAMRVTLAITAPLTDPASLSGSADIHLDEAIYGDDIWFYDAVTSFAESKQYVKVLSETNTFRMVTGVNTCTGVDNKFP